MKIAVLTTESLPHIFLVGELAARFEVEAVLLERGIPRGPRRLLVRDWRRHGGAYALDKALFVLYRRLVLDRRREQIERLTYGTPSMGVPAEQILRVSSINSPEAHHCLETVRPDVLVVAGTTILKPSTIGLAPVALNIHCGILPYYRGIDAVSAAVRLGDHDRIGVTVHTVVPRVDAGDLIAQRCVPFEPGDSLEALETRVFRCGVELMVASLATHRDTGYLSVLRSAFPATTDRLFFSRTLTQHVHAAICLRIAASKVIRSS